MPLDSFDKTIEVIGFIGLLLLIGIPIIYYGKLPENIPTHFDLNGQADGFGSRGMIWILPAIGVLTYIGLFFLNKYPHVFNYPQKVTPENAERLYRIATKMTRILNTLIVCFSAYITYSIIQTALGNQEGLGVGYAITFVVLIMGISGFSLFKSLEK